MARRRYTKKRLGLLLGEGACEGVELMIETMRDPDVKLELRIDCAKECLNRLFGKAGSLEISPQKSAPEVSFAIKGELSDYAE